MICINNAKVVLEHGIIWDGAVLIEGDRIKAVGKREEIEIPKDCEIVDVDGAYIGPGFVDIHVHGGNGYSFNDKPYEAAEYFLAHGETTILGTFYFDLSKDEYIAAAKRVRDAMKCGGAGDAIAGIYMEGPYMNPLYGSNPQGNKWKGEILAEDYEEIVDNFGDIVRMWAIAPERDGLIPFMKYVNKVTPDARFAFGHCEANAEQIRKVKRYGIITQTHCMDATNSVSKWYGVRGNGPDEACLADNEIYAELISDSLGVHVNAGNQRLILKAKGVDKVVLISDSVVSDEKAPPELENVKDLVFDSNGWLGGSKLTMNAACRNIMQHTDCGITQAFLMASRNPAKVLGMDDEIGSIEAGKRANLVLIDDMFNVKKVMLNGAFVK